MRPALGLGCGAPGLRPAAFAGHQERCRSPRFPPRTFAVSDPGGDCGARLRLHPHWVAIAGWPIPTRPRHDRCAVRPGSVGDTSTRGSCHAGRARREGYRFVAASALASPPAAGKHWRTPGNPGAKESDGAVGTVVDRQERIAKQGRAVDLHRVCRHAPAFPASELQATWRRSHFALYHPGPRGHLGSVASRP